MINEQTYFNSRLYDKKGKRIAAFSRQVGDNELEIFLLKCSPLDQFNRALAKMVYSAHLGSLDRGSTTIKMGKKEFHPEIYTIPMEASDKPKYSFLNHCKERFLRPRCTEMPMSVLIDKENNIVACFL